MISEDRLQKALIYLAETDEGIALAKSYLEGLQYHLKTIKAQQYLSASGTNKDKEEQAYASEGFSGHIKKIEDATYDYEKLKNKRVTEVLIVDVWRSLNAARKKGNII